MSISEITGIPGAVDPARNSKNQASARGKASARDSQDRILLSDEARALYEAEQSKRLDTIREKISRGFYFQRDVTEKVVDALMKDLKGTAGG